MKPVEHPVDKVLDVFIGAALVLCLGAIGWVFTGMVIDNPLAKIGRRDRLSLGCCGRLVSLIGCGILAR